MQWVGVCVLVTAAIHSGGGVTKTSGIEQFWTDDYKVFDQIYGKTSDREIYGTNLPSISFTDPNKPQAAEKKERYLFNYQKDLDDIDPSDFGDTLNFLTKPVKEKPPTSTFNFISYSDFKPISQNSDPETYDYLKRLEKAEREKNVEFVKETGGFKPYLSYAGPNPEETEAYRSIQEILDAHEANKGKEGKDDENSKHLTYRELTKTKTNKAKPPRKSNKVSKPRCVPGRCRKRSAIWYRVRSTPYRRIKHRIY